MPPRKPGDPMRNSEHFCDNRGTPSVPNPSMPDGWGSGKEPAIEIRYDGQVVMIGTNFNIEPGSQLDDLFQQAVSALWALKDAQRNRS